MTNSEQRRRWRVAADLGLVGASFASFLVVASIDKPDQNAKSAAELFAVCIPLAVAASSVPALQTVSSQRLQQALFWLHSVLFGIAQIGCAIGIYKLFLSVSPRAGNLFLETALTCYLGFALLYLVSLIVGARERRQLSNDRGAQEEAEANNPIPADAANIIEP